MECGGGGVADKLLSVKDFLDICALGVMRMGALKQCDVGRDERLYLISYGTEKGVGKSASRRSGDIIAGRSCGAGVAKVAGFAGRLARSPTIYYSPGSLQGWRLG